MLSAVFIIWFFSQIAKKFKNKKKYIDDRGYVFLILENDLEHRYIAKNILHRSLRPNEVVHHINGKKTDNQLRNLCVMDREKHELFHSWLKWKKEKSGKYPNFKEQIQILTKEYHGLLLEQIAYEKTNQKVNIVEEKDLQTQGKRIGLNSETYVTTERNLFEELRKERLQIARDEKIPAYMIFYDKTLHLMVKRMPETDLEMLKITGPTKYQKYGPRFLAVINRFKADRASSN